MRQKHTDPRFAGAVDAFARSLAMAKDRLDADVVHCHTWYFLDMGGVLASKLWNVPVRAHNPLARAASPVESSSSAAAIT